MKKIQYILTSGIISIFLFQSGCQKSNKWTAVPLQIKKQESFNYSEMISGDLDSTSKSELEQVKKNTTEKMTIERDNINNSSPSNSKINSILKWIKNTFNRFLDLF